MAVNQDDTIYVCHVANLKKEINCLKALLLRNNVLFRRRGKVGLTQKAILLIFLLYPTTESILCFCVAGASYNFMQQDISRAPIQCSSQNFYKHCQGSWREPHWGRSGGAGWSLFLSVVFPYFVQEHRIFFLIWINKRAIFDHQGMETRKDT